MPVTLKCDACGVSFSIGSYHGKLNQWFNGLYCRQCGVAYTLSQSAEQFLDHFNNTPKLKQHEYLLHSRHGIQHVLVGVDHRTTLVKCWSCGAEGPFGSNGPITDTVPEGLKNDFWPFVPDYQARGTCPRCKQPCLKVQSEWIT